MLTFGFKRLEMFGISVPSYALVNREVPYQDVEYFIEEEDFIEVNGNRFWKPFVEKPVDGELAYIIFLFSFPLHESFCKHVFCHNLGF